MEFMIVWALMIGVPCGIIIAINAMRDSSRLKMMREEPELYEKWEASKREERERHKQTVGKVASGALTAASIATRLLKK